MENNNVTPNPAPAPAPANSMPEFAAAPAAPAPVIPPATSMPSFGEPTPVPQPTAPAVAPTSSPAEFALPTTPEAPVVPETPAAQDAPAAPTSNLGEISNETAPASSISITPAPETKTQNTQENPTTPESQPTQDSQPTSAVSSAVESGPTVPATPAQPTPEKKKINTKLIAIAGSALVLVVAVVIGIVALTSQPKPTTNPADVPVVSYDGPDNSTPFADLDKDGALAFLNAVGKTDSYYPDDFIDETDSDIFPIEGESGSKLLISYETKDQAKTIAFDSMDQSFKSKYADKNLGTSEKVDYTVVYVDQETTDCENCSRYVTFSNKVINHFYNPIVDPITGVTTQLESIVFAKNTEETAKRYLPIVIYLTQNNIVYSTEFKSTDAGFQLVANVIYLGLDEEKMATAEAGEVPRAINLSTITYNIDKASGLFSVNAEMSAANQLKPVKSFSVTDEEVADLI